MKRLITVVLLISSVQLMAQQIPVNIGFYAPYGISPGIKVGTSFKWKDWESTSKAKRQMLVISPQVGFWNYSSYGNTIHNTWNIETHLDYKKFFTQRLYGLTSVGLSYQMETQHQSLNVDLGTGQITPSKELTHYLVPMIHLGLGRDSERIGYYFKTFAGHRFTTTDRQNLFVGLELGLMFYLKK